ncbi:hypothetical protein PTKU64_89770 [Paraburkholderia terrae]|uniref:Uncharacterized protein n=1 Tax=Paraburkholderia terrae TaxID=311230 RepID=A0ABN6JZX1_9BURK|nr:hypothetical protein PTKU64_89770 [Paraburkholderia terrae]BDC45604.1 hypothetical protein PTKU15_89010 [Paraburkholderia terrae]
MQTDRRVNGTRALFRAVALGVLCVSSLACRADQASDRAAIVAQIKASAERITGKPPQERRYTAVNCVAGGVPAGSPLWNSVLADYRNLPVQDCSPTISEPAVEGGHLTGRALLLLPTAAQAAEWIVSACEAQGLNGDPLRQCATSVLKHVNSQNNLQFVIAGVITEPNEEGYLKAESADPACKKLSNANVLYSFRDGITVRLKGQPRTSLRTGVEGGCRPNQPQDLAALIETDPEKVAEFGRVAGLSRSLYSVCTHVALPADDAWRKLVRSSMVAAWSSNRYSMMDAVARAIAAPKGACHY